MSWQPYYLHVPTVYKSGSLNFLEPYGPVKDLYGYSFIFIFIDDNILVFINLFPKKVFLTHWHTNFFLRKRSFQGYL